MPKLTLAAVCTLCLSGAVSEILNMTALTDLNDQNEQLIGGADANPANYPANFYTTQGNSRCSGTVIGEKVLSTAAHCVKDSGSAVLKFKGVNFTGVCTHHPNYKDNKTADWALCLLDKPIAGIKFENIMTDLSPLKVGSVVELTGYGCTKENGKGGNDGTFRVGKIKIKKTPSGNSNDVVTEGNVALCYGDSGGSAYYYSGSDRYMFANNSRGNISSISYLSSYTKVFVSWASQWSASKGVKICGLHKDAVNCRSSSPLPSPGGQEPSPLPAPSPDATSPEGLTCRAAFSKIWSCLFGG